MAATIGPVHHDLPDEQAGWTLRELLVVAITVVVVSIALAALVLRTTSTVAAFG